MTYERNSAASDVSLAPFGLRIVRAMQPSAVRGETADYVAKRSRGTTRLDECFSPNSMGCLRNTGMSKAVASRGRRR